MKEIQKKNSVNSGKNWAYKNDKKSAKIEESQKVEKKWRKWNYRKVGKIK